MSNKQQDDRRNTRCGIILGMITILISTLLFLFNFEKYIFNVRCKIKLQKVVNTLDM